jgi:hypothetical protein
MAGKRRAKVVGYGPGKSFEFTIRSFQLLRAIANPLLESCVQL